MPRMLKSFTPKAAVTLILGIVLFGCASLASLSPPALQNRTLRLSQDSPSLEYQYDVCIRRFLGLCTAHGPHVDKYDLTKPEVRKQLIDMGFVMKVREKP